MSVYYECDMCGKKNLGELYEPDMILIQNKRPDGERFERDICKACSEKIKKPFNERLRKWYEEYESKAKTKQIVDEVIEKIEHEARWGKLSKTIKEEVIREIEKSVYLRPGTAR